MSIEMNPIRTTVVRPVSVDTRGIGLSQAELISAIQSSVIAAYVMGLVAMVVVWIHNWATWMPFNDVAGSLFPSLASGNAFNPAAVVVGLGVHTVTSIGLGIIFAVLYCRVLKTCTNTGIPVLVGFGFGLFTWLIARLILLPILGSAIYAAPSFLVAHLIFGAVLGVLYPMMLAHRLQR